MNLKQFNDSFKNVYSSVKETYSEKQQVVDTLQRDVLSTHSNFINDYVNVLQESLESLYPDRSWWEITKCNISESLLRTSDVQRTIDEIVEGIEFSDSLTESNDFNYKGYTCVFTDLGEINILDKDFKLVKSGLGSSEEAHDWIDSVTELDEDTVQKSNGKWTNRGDDGEEHGEFETKKQADAQRKAMYANGYKG